MVACLTMLKVLRLQSDFFSPLAYTKCSLLSENFPATPFIHFGTLSQVSIVFLCALHLSETTTRDFYAALYKITTIAGSILLILSPRSCVIISWSPFSVCWPFRSPTLVLGLSYGMDFSTLHSPQLLLTNVCIYNSCRPVCFIDTIWV